MSNKRKTRIALALAGGGPLGAIYEIGALCALQDCLQGLEWTALDHYVGVSAGGFIAAGLANGISPRQQCLAFIAGEGQEAEVFDPALLMVPAYAEFAQRLLSLPWLGAAALWRLGLGRQSVMRTLEQMAPVLPTGIFSSEQVHNQLRRLFSAAGRSNDFRALNTQLTLVATDLDSGETAPFGQTGWDHVPISRAVQASAALPGLFPPVRIDGRDYVDGALKKTLHASVALEQGADLLLCINPLVPFDTRAPQAAPASGRVRAVPPVVAGGLPSVLSQTFRTLIYSRLELGMKHYEHAYPGRDIVLIEPDHNDPELYLANTFSYRQRRELAEHAYQQTRRWLRQQQTQLAPKLKRHGIVIDTRALNDPNAHLLKEQRASPNTNTRLGQALQQLHTVTAQLQQTLDERVAARG